MTEADALEKIAAFTQAVANSGALWVDIDVLRITPYSATIGCRTTLSHAPDFEVNFGPVFFASLPMTWSCEMALPVLKLVTGDEAFRLNTLYQVETGYHWFMFHSRDLSPQLPFLVAAESVSWHPTQL